jgi:signal transduction histidine kinase
MRPGAERDDPAAGGVLDVLSRADDPDLVDLVELVAQICDSESAGITIMRGDQYHVPITHGIEPLVCSADDSFCRYTMNTDGVFCVEDAQSDARFASIGFVDGTLARARFYASAPIYSPGGEMVGRLCVIDSRPKTLTELQQRTLEALALNITKLIELRLLRAERVASAAPPAGEAATTIMSQLGAELSHDMRVPLSSIIACVEMLTEELAHHPDRTVGALLGRAMRAADRMVRMLDQQMEPGSAGGPAAISEVDLNQVMQQLLLDSASLLESAGAVVDVGELPVVRADPDGMYSVLQNLLTNSLKFARPGVPAEVHVSGRRTHDSWRITVRDNGMGIPADRHGDVFSLFTRVEHDVEGHGIGLATVARVLAAHGGSAGVEPVEGAGAAVWFELPDDEPDGQ